MGRTTEKALGRFLREAKRERGRAVGRFQQVAAIAVKNARETISCGGVGCHGCCYQLPPVAAWEGILIAKHLIETDQHSLAWRAIKQGRAVARMAGRIGCGLVEGAKKVSAAWYARQIPCVFLDGKKACAIYPIRPVACATYAVTSDPERCYGEAIQTVRFIDNSAALAWAIASDKLLSNWYSEDPAGPLPVTSLGASIEYGYRRLSGGWSF